MRSTSLNFIRSGDGTILVKFAVLLPLLLGISLSAMDFAWTLTHKAVLQDAADAGVPLADHGAGHFYIPPEVEQAFRETTLPSLLHAWDQKMAVIMAGHDPAPPPPG